MLVRNLIAAVLLCFGTIASVAPAQAAPPAPPQAATDAAEQNSAKEAVARAVCTVTAENKWGVPTGVATGFLLTDGKFAITDLGLVSQPGVTQATLRFKDASKSVCREFAMADASLDLVALRVDGDAAGRAGLPLGAGLPALDGSVTVTTAGWRWASQLDAITGRLVKGPAIKDAAALAHADTPTGVDSFVRADGPRLEAATGSVLLDPAGTVLGTVLEVTIRGVSAPLAIPASALRTALMSAQPQLKALPELPKSPWPTRYLRVPGQPATSAAFAGAMAAAKKAMVCPTCQGRGTNVTILKAAGGGGGGGGGWGGGGPGGGGPGWGGPGGWPPGMTPTCFTCRGEKFVVSNPFWQDLIQVIEMGTRTVWAPATDDRSRLALHREMLTTLKGLTTVGQHFDGTLNSTAAADIRRAAAPPARGMLVRAQVKEHMDGPDGKYLLLAPLDANTSLAVRLDDMMQLGGKANLGDRREPADGGWLLLCGMVLSRFDDGKHQGAFVLPLEWVPVVAPPAPDPAGGGPPFGRRGPPPG